MVYENVKKKKKMDFENVIIVALKLFKFSVQMTKKQSSLNGILWLNTLSSHYMYMSIS